jgi:hypothetical protein
MSAEHLFSNHPITTAPQTPQTLYYVEESQSLVGELVTTASFILVLLNSRASLRSLSRTEVAIHHTERYTDIE